MSTVFKHHFHKKQKRVLGYQKSKITTIIWSKCHTKMTYNQSNGIQQPFYLKMLCI